MRRRQETTWHRGGVGGPLRDPVTDEVRIARYCLGPTIIPFPGPPRKPLWAATQGTPSRHEANRGTFTQWAAVGGWNVVKP